MNLPILAGVLHDPNQAEYAENAEALHGPVGAPELVEHPSYTHREEGPVHKHRHKVEREPCPQVAYHDAVQAHLHVVVFLVAGEEQPRDVDGPVDCAEEGEDVEDREVREGHGVHRYQDDVVEYQERGDQQPDHDGRGRRVPHPAAQEDIARRVLRRAVRAARVARQDLLDLAHLPKADADADVQEVFILPGTGAAPNRPKGGTRPARRGAGWIAVHRRVLGVGLTISDDRSQRPFVGLRV
mmetsp:Transcript_103319/g.292736  ORF Transcript_103319/g.292736 Transcript_103319/m.292736 type:complete len:241 (-) Transcript_103319:130-852(-)